MMLYLFGSLILLIVAKSANCNECLAVLDADSCFKIQEAGEKLANSIKQSDKTVQDTIYRSLMEGVDILNSAVRLLKKDVQSIRVTHTGTAPIESSQMTVLVKDIENTAKQSVQEANTKLRQLLRDAVKTLLGDNVIALKVLKEPSGQTKRSLNIRYRRQSSADTTDLGNTLDGVIQQMLPQINEALKTSNSKMKMAFRNVFDKFTDSIKALLNGKVQTDFDQVKTTMEDMLSKESVTIIDSNNVQIKMLFMDAVKNLLELSAIADKFKQDPTKLSKALTPARNLVLECIESTQKVSDETGLLKKIDDAVQLIKGYYEEIKNTVLHTSSR